MSEIDILLGRSIANLRVSRKLSQEDLAGRIGVSPKTIDAFEKGTRRATAVQLFALSQALEVRIEGLFSSEEQFEARSSTPVLPPETHKLAGHYHALGKSHRSAIFSFLLAVRDDNTQTRL